MADHRQPREAEVGDRLQEAADPQAHRQGKRACHETAGEAAGQRGDEAIELDDVAVLVAREAELDHEWRRHGARQRVGELEQHDEGQNAIACSRWRNVARRQDEDDNQDQQCGQQLRRGTPGKICEGDEGRQRAQHPDEAEHRIPPAAEAPSSLIRRRSPRPVRSARAAADRPGSVADERRAMMPITHAALAITSVAGGPGRRAGRSPSPSNRRRPETKSAPAVAMPACRS